MATQREKTVSYRRAEWFLESPGPTLEKYTRNAYSILKAIDDRTIIRGGQFTRFVKHRDGHDGGFLLHLTTETPGEHASVVPRVMAGMEELDLKTEKPPKDGEWLDGDAFLFLDGNHVCLCSTGIRDGAIAFVLHELFKKAKLPKDSIRFELMKAADISKIKMLHKQGVKELEIRAVLYKATANYERRKKHVVASLGAAGKFFKTFLNKPNDVTPDALRVMLTIKTDKRFVKALKLGEKQLETMAADVVNHSEKEDDYVIVTKTGQKISPNEIFMKSTALIDSDGKTVDRDKAWLELERFYKELKDGGVFEQ